MMTIEERFGKLYDDKETFENIKHKKSNRKDLHAFLLMAELFPEDNNIIDCVSHDQIWFCPKYEDIEKLTDEQILEFVRCSVFVDEGSLTMFI